MTENAPQSDTSMNIILPKFLEKNIATTDWKVVFDETYCNVLLENNELVSELTDEFSFLLDSSFADFRFQIMVKGTPFLCALFYEEKTVRLASPRLSNELFLIYQIQQSETKEFIQDEKQYDDFLNFTSKIAEQKIEYFPSEYEVSTLKRKLPELLPGDQQDQRYQNVNSKMQACVDQLLKEINKYSPSWFERVSDFGLTLTAKYALIRIHLLKFLAILPSLDHDNDGHEVKRILLEAFRRLLSDNRKSKRLKKKGDFRALPKRYVYLFNLAYRISYIFPAGVLASLVRTSVRFMAKRFIAGEAIETATESIKLLSESKRDVTLDQLGELVVSEKEADNYQDEVIKLIRGFSKHYTKGELNKAGINRAHVSIKVSALCSDFKPYAFDYTYKLVSPRLIKILKEAKEHDVFINIDAEHYHYRDVVFKIYEKVLLETNELKDYKATGIVLQAYLRDSFEHLQEIIALGEKRGITMPIRIVKGAYWDAETVEADAHSFIAPEFLNKEETDLNFRQMIFKIFENYPHVQLCLASHNFADHAFAEVLRKEHFEELPEIEHQCLHMTYEALSTAMANLGWVTRNYVPIGSLIIGMAYLVRRIMENSSQVGVLTIMRSHKKQISLVGPEEVHLQKKKDRHLTRDVTQTGLTERFFNVALNRIYLQKELKTSLDSLENFKKNLGNNFSNSFLLNGAEQKIFSSSDLNVTVGKLKFASVEDTHKAIEVADNAYNKGLWANAHWLTRSQVLIRAAQIMLAKRMDLTALIMYEAGKTINEALADVDEAVDFLNFYAREERKVNRHHKEARQRGLVGVISPWNFPLAIPCGMVAAPLVAGNTVILKSAEQTPLIASALVDIFHEAGVDKDVLIHLPGEGETVGAELVKHPRVSSIVFTGSKAVGMMIHHEVSKRTYENKLTNCVYPAMAITEMGGKNAVIVTENAELDETVAGVLYSAYGHAGQKCSAASRVIVSNAVKDRLIERLKEASLDIKVGEAYDYSTFVNPLISVADKERIKRQVKEAAEEVRNHGGKVIVDRSLEELPGNCVGPSVFEVKTKRSFAKDSFAQVELFAPVVHIIGFDTLDEALRIYNSTDYALTGGVFSQSQDDINYLMARMESGNIYINRGITGARVSIEPFGGFKLSGTGPKAGSKHYVNQFHQLPHQETHNNIEATNDGEKGVDSEIHLARPSGLSDGPRIRRVIRGVGDFMKNFESLFQGIYGQSKDNLSSFYKWSDKYLSDYLIKDHSNRKIPGQMSYNDYRLHGEHAAFIAYSDKPDFKTLLYLFSALSVGTGVTVLCRNEYSLKWWKRVNNIFVRNRLSKENFKVYFPTKEALIKTLKDPMLSYICVDGDIKKVQEISAHVFDKSYTEKRMKKILTSYDAPAMENFKAYVRTFVWVRAFAVNTMRHGAPMDVEI